MNDRGPGRTTTPAAQRPATLRLAEPSLAPHDFAALYDEHARPLWCWLATRAPASDIDDIAQEIWIKVAEQKFPGGNFRAWLFQVARNQLIDRSRRASVRMQKQTLSISGVDSQGEATEWPLIACAEPDNEQAEEELRLKDCLSKLDNVKRAVVQGWLDDVKYVALGAELGLTDVEISNHMKTAKNQLRRCLESSAA